MLIPVSNEINLGNKKSPWIPIYGDSEGQLKLLRSPRFSAQLPVRLAQRQTRLILEENLRTAEFKMALYAAYTATKNVSGVLYRGRSFIRKVIDRSYTLAGALVSDDMRMIKLFREGRKESNRITKILKEKLPPPLTQSEIRNLKAADLQKLKKLNSVDKFNSKVAAINRMYLKAIAIAAKSQQRYDKLDNDQNGLYGRYAKANENGKSNTEELQKSYGPAISKWDENSRDSLYFYRAVEKSYLRAVELQKQLKNNTNPGAYPDLNKLREVTEQLNKLRKQMLDANKKIDVIAKQLES